MSEEREKTPAEAKHDLYVLCGPEAREYLCEECREFRLSVLGNPTECGNCGSKRLVIDKVGALNKLAAKAARERV